MATKKIKRFQPGGFVTSDGKPVLDGSGQPVMSGRFPDEDEITARGRARNAAMFRSFANRLTGKKEEAKKPPPAVSGPTPPRQETSGLQAVSPPAASAAKDVIVTPIPNSPPSAGPQTGPKPGQPGSGQTFGQAFNAARKDGKKTFPFKGKIFTTETKEDVAKRRSNKARQQATEKKEIETNRIKRSVGDAVSKAEAKKTEASPAQKFREQNKKGVSPLLTGALGFGAGFAGKKLVQAGARKLASKKAASTATKSPLRQKTEELIKGDKNPGRSVSPATSKGSLKDKTKELIRDNRTAKSNELSRQMAAQQKPTKFTSKSKAAPRNTKKFNEEESGVEFKRGGKICMASKRGDGIAVKGKTRGKVY